MRSQVIFALCIALTAAVFVRFIETQERPYRGASDPSLASLATARPVKVPNYAASQSQWDDEVHITASPDQQFYTSALVNRSSSRFLVDTGASFVALRETDAFNAGIQVAPNAYNFPVRTANGETNAALITLGVIEIGGLRVENVKAFVLRDDQLSVNLLGMTFLSRLGSVEARGGELILRG